MADKTEFLQAIDDAILDADSLERFINGDDTQDVLTRLSKQYPTLQKALKELFEKGGIADRFKTLADLQASPLVDGDYALVADDVDSKNGIYIKESGAWVKSKYDPMLKAVEISEQNRKKGENFIPLIWFFNPYYEHSNGYLYFRPSVTSGNILTADDSRLGGRWFLTEADWAAFLTENSLTLETSPLGKTDCLKIPRGKIICVDPNAKKLVLKNSFNTGDTVPMVFEDYGRIGRCVEEPLIRYQIANQELKASDKVINSSIASEKITTNNSIAAMGKISSASLNLWTFDAYYEAVSTPLKYVYFKPNQGSSSDTDYAIYLYDRRFPYMAKTVAEVYQAVTDYCTRSGEDYSTFVKTSPNGVENCICFVKDTMLVIDLVTFELVFDVRNNLMKLVYPNPVQVIICAAYSDWGACSEELNIRQAFLEATIQKEVSSNLVGSIPEFGIKSIAHRGYSYVYPENTLAAFKGAKKAGYDYVECDVYRLADGQIVLHHDTELGRIIPLDGDIRERTYDELKDFDIGSWKDPKFSGERIPTIEEFLRLCKILGLHPYIETKGFNGSDNTVLVNKVAEAGLRGNVTYMSGNINSLRDIVAADPEARVGYYCNATKENIDLVFDKPLSTGRNEVIMGLSHTTIT